mgnify:CR=1 FL=1
MTVVFDHLFGTYQAEPSQGVGEYGIKEVMNRKNIIHEIFVQWKALYKAVRATPGLLSKLILLFRSPESLEKIKT